jgi:hypothetical protein
MEFGKSQIPATSLVLGTSLFGKSLIESRCYLKVAIYGKQEGDHLWVAGLPKRSKVQRYLCGVDFMVDVYGIFRPREMSSLAPVW